MNIKKLSNIIAERAGYNGKPEQWQRGFNLCFTDIQRLYEVASSFIKTHDSLTQAKRNLNTVKCASMEHVIEQNISICESLGFTDELNKFQKIVLTGFTGINFCNDFSDFHKDCEQRMGRPIMTHELPSLIEEIKELYTSDFKMMVGSK